MIINTKNDGGRRISFGSSSVSVEDVDADQIGDKEQSQNGYLRRSSPSFLGLN